MKNKKELMGVLVFYLIIVLAVIILNARFESLNKCRDEGHSQSYCVEVGR